MYVAHAHEQHFDHTYKPLLASQAGDAHSFTMSADSLHRRLRPLIGKRFDYLGEVWILIEVLGDVDAVVLRRCVECKRGSVQRNAFGIPNRRAGDTLTLPISEPGSDAFSQDLLVLLEGKQPDSG